MPWNTPWPHEGNRVVNKEYHRVLKAMIEVHIRYVLLLNTGTGSISVFLRKWEKA